MPSKQIKKYKKMDFLSILQNPSVSVSKNKKQEENRSQPIENVQKQKSTKKESKKMLLQQK